MFLFPNVILFSVFCFIYLAFLFVQIVASCLPFKKGRDGVTSKYYFISNQSFRYEYIEFCYGMILFDVNDLVGFNTAIGHRVRNDSTTPKLKHSRRTRQ